jgi:hypothetical protein
LVDTAVPVAGCNHGNTHLRSVTNDFPLGFRLRFLQEEL